MIYSPLLSWCHSPWLPCKCPFFTNKSACHSLSDSSTTNRSTMAVQRAVTTVATLSGLAFGQILTAIDPCPVAPSNLTVLHASCIVTEQHQPISTCTSASNSLGWSTYAWVDTTIPCWGSIGISSCTVTQTDQVVPCTASTNTITSIVPTSTNMGNGTYKTWNVTGYTTVSKLWQARYKDLGGLAIPGYDGCGLCTNCALSDGSRQQMINVFECLDISGQAAQCSQFVDTWVSSVCPFTTGAVSAAISSYTAIPSRGVYTWYFPQPAPTTTIQSDNQVYTVPAQPWTASFTRSFAGPTNCAIVSTVTKSLIYVVPLSTISATDRATVTDGQQQWANWYGLKTTSRATTSLSSQGEWSIWASLAQSQQSTSTSTTATSTSSEPTNTAMSSSSDSGQVGGITTTTATLTAFSTSMTSASTTTTLLTSTSPSSTATLSTSTSSMSSTLTSTSSTLTTTGGQTQATTFVIQLTSAGLKRRYTKRTDVTYLCFLDGSDNASTCLASQDAARFSFDSSGYLRTGNLYISDVSSSAGYFVFERTSLKPVSPPPYTRGADGAFIRTTAGGFCATPSNFFVSISNSPSNCTPVTAVAVQGKSYSCLSKILI